MSTGPFLATRGSVEGLRLSHCAECAEEGVNFSQPGRQVSNYRKRLAERRLGLNKLLKTRIEVLMSCTSGGSVSRKQRHGQQPSWIPNQLGRRSPLGRRVPVMGGTSLRCQTAGTTASGILAPRGALATGTGTFPGRNFVTNLKGAAFQSTLREPPGEGAGSRS